MRAKIPVWVLLISLVSFGLVGYIVWHLSNGAEVANSKASKPHAGVVYAPISKSLLPNGAWRPTPEQASEAQRASNITCFETTPTSASSWSPRRSDGLCHIEDALPSPTLLPQPPTPQPHMVSITNGALTIGAGAFSWYSFVIPQGTTIPSVTGRFIASGGAGNDVQVYILDDDGFVNFKNGHAARAYYNSGRVTQAAIGAELPNLPATYYLVFDNRFSAITPKAVNVNASLNYMQ